MSPGHSAPAAQRTPQFRFASCLPQLSLRPPTLSGNCSLAATSARRRALQASGPSAASLSTTSRSEASMIQKPPRYVSFPAWVSLGHTAGPGRSSSAAPTSPAWGRHVRCILRAPGGPVDLERYPLRVGSRVDQVKRQVQAGVGEQPRALANDHGADEQVDLVDKLVVEQPPGHVVRTCRGQGRSAALMLSLNG